MNHTNTGLFSGLAVDPVPGYLANGGFRRDGRDTDPAMPVSHQHDLSKTRAFSADEAPIRELAATSEGPCTGFLHVKLTHSEPARVYRPRFHFPAPQSTNSLSAKFNANTQRAVTVNDGHTTASAPLSDC